MLSNFKVVLVETSHPGNIGAVARAMKNMQIEHLRLVQPKMFPHADATARAAGAVDLLKSVSIYADLPAAIADCEIVIGASARTRTISWPELTPKQCAEKWVVSAQNQQNIALVFGRENSGLKNHELDLCQFLLHIPCNPEFSSLNLAAAVQVVCYELFAADSHHQLKNQKTIDLEAPLATSEQMEAFYHHLQETLSDIGFSPQERSKSLMRRLRRVFNRTGLDTKELDILRGILRFSQNHNEK